MGETKYQFLSSAEYAHCTYLNVHNLTDRKEEKNKNKKTLLEGINERIISSVHFLVSTNLSNKILRKW